MQVLIDTHAFLWWLDGDERLSPAARAVMEAADVECLVSAASVWEIATKYRLGKLPSAQAIARDITGNIERNGFVALEIAASDAELAGKLPGEHRDPFDRMIAAQCLRRGLAVVTADAQLVAFGVNQVW
jgi:PIN domain nuclease of toxin-antitoxin system